MRGHPAPVRDELPLPGGVAPEDLADEVRLQLRSLPSTLAERVAGHLAGAGALLEEDPELAFRHAERARQLASRVPACREAAGLTAYAIGRYDVAARELRAYQRMTGDVLHLPVLADCERGMGRPERALALATGPEAKRLTSAARVELLLVQAGARRDLGQPQAAVLALQVPELRSGEREDWWVRLAYGYGDALLAAGRRGEGVGWFVRAARADQQGQTDARERLADLLGQPMPPDALSLVEIGSDWPGAGATDADGPPPADGPPGRQSDEASGPGEPAPA